MVSGKRDATPIGFLNLQETLELDMVAFRESRGSVSARYMYSVCMQIPCVRLSFIRSA